MLGSAGSLDNPIRALQQRRRDRPAERPGGLQVDGQLELGRLLDGQIAGLGALQNLVDVGSGATKQICKVRSIGHEAALSNAFTPWVDRRQSVSGRQVYEAPSFIDEHAAGWHRQRTGRCFGNFGEAPAEFPAPAPLTDCNRAHSTSTRAAASASFSTALPVRSPRPPGCQRAATRPTPGTACVSCSRHLPTSSGANEDNPVTLPPGRARLLTSPLVTGSPGPAKTMGRVWVACLAAWAAGVPPTTMTSLLRATSSPARAGSRSSFPAASRYSMTTLRPST